MRTLEEVKNAFQADRFAMEAAGIEIVSSEKDEAVCRMKLTDLHCNARGKPMGGAIFTLADFAAAVAANGQSEQGNVISLHCDITYLSAAKGTTLLAYAKCVKRGRSTTLYQVSVTDEYATPVAEVSVNGFVLDEQFYK